MYPKNQDRFTVQNFEIKTNVSWRFFFFPVCMILCCISTSGVLRTLLLIEIFIHSGDMCTLASVGGSCACAAQNLFELP